VYFSLSDIYHRLFFGSSGCLSFGFAGEDVPEKLSEMVELCLICETDTISLRVVKIVCV
jgi:hypothetical protein